MLLSNEEVISAVSYFLKVLRRRASNDSLSSLHMIEGTRRSFNKLINHILECPTKDSRQVKSALVQLLSAKLIKNLERLMGNSQGVNKLDIKRWHENCTVLIKCLTEGLSHMLVSAPAELKWFITEHKTILMQLICLGGENPEIIVRSQAQQLFLFVLKQVLELRLPLREEIEFMYIKVVLKPLELKQPNAPVPSEDQQPEQVREVDLLGDPGELVEPALVKIPTQEVIQEHLEEDISG